MYNELHCISHNLELKAQMYENYNKEIQVGTLLNCKSCNFQTEIDLRIRS